MECSLSVSPDPDHPLVAMVALKNSKERVIQIYDYKTKHQILELEAKGIILLLLHFLLDLYNHANTHAETTSCSPASIVFHPNEMFV